MVDNTQLIDPVLLNFLEHAGLTPDELGEAGLKKAKDMAVKHGLYEEYEKNASEEKKKKDQQRISMMTRPTKTPSVPPPTKPRQPPGPPLSKHPGASPNMNQSAKRERVKEAGRKGEVGTQNLEDQKTRSSSSGSYVSAHTEVQEAGNSLGSSLINKPPDAASQQPSKPERGLVLFPYTAQNDDELTLEQGQTILITSREVDDKGWWKGEVDGKTGLFPENFVKRIVEEDRCVLQ